MPQCTGECCHEVELSNHGKALTLRDAIASKDRTQNPEIAILLYQLRPINDEQTRFGCVALGEHGCLLPREQRSWICTAYPYGGFRCYACGAMSDSEARGVALEIPWRHL